MKVGNTGRKRKGRRGGRTLFNRVFHKDSYFDHFFFGLRAELFFCQQPQFIKNATHWHAFKWIGVPYSETIASLLNLTPP
jgi:hypothetical protein